MFENLTVINESCRVKLQEKSKVIVKNLINNCPR